MTHVETAQQRLTVGGPATLRVSFPSGFHTGWFSTRMVFLWIEIADAKTDAKGRRSADGQPLLCGFYGGHMR